MHLHGISAQPQCSEHADEAHYRNGGIIINYSSRMIQQPETRFTILKEGRKWRIFAMKYALALQERCNIGFYCSRHLSNE